MPLEVEELVLAEAEAAFELLATAAGFARWGFFSR